MAEEKKNRSEELESLDKKINEIINGWNQNPEVGITGIYKIRKRLLNFYSSPANFLTLIHHAT